MINEATRDFIRRHQDADVRQLALQTGKESGVDISFALEQIAGRQKARTKIPSWAAVDDILYPSHLSMEQCSSEATARYKAEICGRGRLFVDLTAGFGVDAAFISEQFSKAVCVEQQERLSAISSANFQRLGLTHVQTVCGDGVAFLHSMEHADLLFIDPARRDAHGSRTYGIADCTPNVLEIIGEMLVKADRVLLKLSPMLDWRKAVDDLRSNVTSVHIVSVDNECKELLIELGGEDLETNIDGPRVVCVNLHPDGSQERMEFNALHPSSSAPHPSLSTAHSSLSDFHFLYEPNASIMKAGCFDLVAREYDCCQLEKNSHLFVSEAEIPDFPGRRFIIGQVTSMNRHELKEALAGVSRANIAVRNFPMTVAELRKRLKLKDGGDVYIFATMVENHGYRLFVCRKIS